MKVLISADMEGVCGVVSWTQVTPPEFSKTPSAAQEYETARLRLTREVNAAVEGALASGVEEVIVNEAHDGMRNLLLESLHPDIRVITGNDKPFGMLQGIDELGVQAVFFLGFHAKAGTVRAPLAHTWTRYVRDVTLDDVSVGEAGIYAALAGMFNVPVVLVTGDDQAVKQTCELLGKHVEGIAVKQGYSSYAAIHLHPEEAQKRIYEGAKTAISNFSQAKPWHISENSCVAVTFDHETRADQSTLIPGVSRHDACTVSFTIQSREHYIHTLRAVIRIAGVISS